MKAAAGPTYTAAASSPPAGAGGRATAAASRENIQDQQPETEPIHLSGAAGREGRGRGGGEENCQSRPIYRPDQFFRHRLRDGEIVTEKFALQGSQTLHWDVNWFTWVAPRKLRDPHFGETHFQRPLMHFWNIQLRVQWPLLFSGLLHCYSGLGCAKYMEGHLKTVSLKSR